MAGKAWLLTWNPDRFVWDDISECAEATQEGYTLEASWACRCKDVEPGDRMYLILLGKGYERRRGLVASGTATSEPYEGDHWVDENGNKGTTRYVDIDFDMIIDPFEQKVLKQEVLKNFFPDQTWSPQSSGISIKDEYVKPLENLWQNFTDRYQP